ncbi:MAG: TonB-dependent receptor [candidate division KSB1 bacterium]|nr:TonB-dependent receptor [candidate division KSB1 bacterium]
MKKRLVLFFLPIFLMAAASFHELTAGTTGKIAGRVTDAETNEPLPGVNITVEGTTTGAATDLSGNYQIINLPPGQYTLLVSMMGYTSQRIEGVRVNIDLTTTQNIKLRPTVLEAGEEVTVVAERPIVQMDMTGSLATVSAEEIKVLPAQSTNYLVGLTAGVVDAGGIHIRGGRSSEVAYWVDGVASTDAFYNSSTAAVENTAVQELQVISGTFNAEYGQAMSGIINIITKDGGSVYNGEIKGYVGDYVSSDPVYGVLKYVRAETDSLTNKTTVYSESEDPLTKFNPTYNLEGSLSGPVPFTNSKLTFFLNGRYYQQDGYLYGREWFLPCGLPGDSSLVPMQAHHRYTGLGKLTWAISPSIKLRYSLNVSDWKNDRYWSRQFKYAPRGLSPSWGYTTTHLLSLNHVLSNRTFYEFKVNRMYTESRSYLYEDPTKTPHWLVYLPGDSVNAPLTFAPEDNPALLDSLKTYGIQYRWIPDPAQPWGYVSEDSSRTPIGYSYSRAGNDLGRNFRSSAYWIAKFDLTSQINSTHQIKTGAELRLHEFNLDSYTLRAKTDENGTAIVPFQPVIPPKESLYRDAYDEPRRPREFSMYVQDKIELKDLIMNIGLRFDYFNSNWYVPVDPMDPSIYTPMKPENKWVDPTADKDQLVEWTPEQRKSFMWKKANAKTQLSPRLGIAYPITDKGVIHFSYGHFFQIPDFQYLYAAPGFKLNTGGGSTIFGNADLNAQRTTQYEIGLQQELAPGLGIDVTLFYRDIRDWVGTAPIQKTVRDVVSYSTFENKDYANVRGITFRGEQRFTNIFSAKVDYTFQVAEGTYSNPTDAFYAEQSGAEPRRKLIPLNWDQNHTLNLQLMVRPGTWTASLVGKFNTGLPYTPTFAKGAFVGGFGTADLPENSARRPDIYSADLYVTKTFPLGRLHVMAFAYVYNLFDNRMATAVFSDTGSAEYTTDPRPEEVLYNPLRIGTVEDLYLRPEWYIAPRQVQLGLSLGF